MLTVLFLRGAGVALTNTGREASWDDVLVTAMTLSVFVLYVSIAQMMLYPVAYCPDAPAIDVLI